MYNIIYGSNGTPYTKDKVPLSFATGKEAAEFVKEYNDRHQFKLRIIKAPTKPEEELRAKIKTGEYKKPIFNDMFGLECYEPPVHCPHHRGKDVTKVYF